MYPKLFILFFLTGSFLHGQHNPVVTYYASSEYKAHQQNWAVLSSRAGDVYAANTSGVLWGNGNRWELYPLMSNKIVRSLCMYKDELYTGSYGETGVWRKDDCENIQYENLSHTIGDKSFPNEEVWHMVSDGESLYLQSFSLLLRYKNKKFSRIPTRGTILFLQMVDGKKLLPILENGIYEMLPGDQMVLLPGTDFFINKTVTGIVPFRAGSYLITTNNHGIYVYENKKVRPWFPAMQSMFKEVQVNKCLKIKKNGLYLIGTINAGLYVMTEDGTPVYHFHAGNGLYNNTVLSLHENKKGDIWVGLDKGMACISFSSTDQEYKDTYGHYGSIYSIKEHQGTLYMATNQGVYMYNGSQSEKFPEFRLLPGTQGQSWQLFTAQEQLYCGHNDGLLRIEKNQGKNISAVTGGWMNEPVPNTGEKIWLQGHYTGMAVFEIQNGKLRFRHKVEGYRNPVKKFIVYNDFIWVTGPNQGLHKLQPDSSFQTILKAEKYGPSKGMNNSENIDMYLFLDTLRVFNGQHHFYYDSSTDRFRDDIFFQSFRGSFIVRPLENDFWLQIFQDRVVLMKGRTPQKYIPKTMTKDYHHVVQNRDGRYFLCLEDGYHVLSLPTSPEGVTEHPDNIHVVISGNKTSCQGEGIANFDVGNQSYKVTFFDYLYVNGKMYEYRLLPLHQDWKPTHTTSSIEFENLNPGKYSLEIRRPDLVTATASISVNHPWYSGYSARAVYGLLALGFFLFGKRYHEKQLKVANEKFAAEQERLTKQHEIELENQRLQHENQLKNRELANSALQLVQKNEILQDIKNELIEIRKSSTHTLTTKDFQIMMKQINENLTLQEDKNLFDTRFEEMHETFLTALKHHFPALTRDDLRLAAFLRMEMPTKEIAPLFNLSIRGLENKRYRLRKKLGLNADDSLAAFFKQIENK